MKLWTVKELIAHEFKQEPCLVQPFFPTQGLGVFYGAQTSGKSQLALTLALEVARGGRFLEQFQCQQGLVVYIQVDMPDQLMQGRLRRVEAEIADLPVHFLSQNNYINIQKIEREPTPEFEAARALEPDLVIFDSLRKIHGLDENKSETVALVYAAATSLFPDSARLFIHHDNKDQAGLFQLPAHLKGRGSGAWLDDADMAIHVRRVARGKGGQHTARLTFTKHYDCPEDAVPPISVAMDHETLMMTPKELSVRQHALIYLADNQEANKVDLIKHLLSLRKDDDKPICHRSWADEVARELIYRT